MGSKEYDLKTSQEGTHPHRMGLRGSSPPGVCSAERWFPGDHSLAHSCKSLPAQGRRPHCLRCADHAGFWGVADTLWKGQTQSSCWFRGILDKPEPSTELENYAYLAELWIWNISQRLLCCRFVSQSRALLGSGWAFQIQGLVETFRSLGLWSYTDYEILVFPF